jgi:hypothetical protein
MAFDPTLPVENTPLDAAQMRDQLNGLNDLIQQRPDVNAMEADAAGPALSVNYLHMTVSNPPTQAEMQTIADKLDELLVALRRE